MKNPPIPIDRSRKLHVPDGFKAGVHPAEDRANFHFTERGVALITPGMPGQQVHSVG